MANNLTVVDNKGQGDCGYHSYSISLIYYLKRTSGKIADFQNLFNLSLDEVRQLQAIINDKDEIIKTTSLDTIQTILTLKARALAAKETKDVFLQNPEASEFHAVLNFKLRQNIKTLLQKTQPDIANKIEVAVGKQADDDYNSAELLQVKELKAPIEAYTQALVKNFKALPLEGLNNKSSQAQIDAFFAKNTTTFFTQNNNKHLDTYSNHIGTSGIWAQDEQLATLHTAINNHLKQQKKEEIPLAIYRNDILVSGSESKNTGIVLNNIDNRHWQSRVLSTSSDYTQQQKSDNLVNEYQQTIAEFDQKFELNEGENLNQEVEVQLDTYLDKIKDNDELTNLHALAKEDLKHNDKQVACLFFQRYEEIKQDQKKQASPSLE